MAELDERMAQWCGFLAVDAGGGDFGLGSAGEDVFGDTTEDWHRSVGWCWRRREVRGVVTLRWKQPAKRERALGTLRQEASLSGALLLEP